MVTRLRPDGVSHDGEAYVVTEVSRDDCAPVFNPYNGGVIGKIATNDRIVVVCDPHVVGANTQDMRVIDAVNHLGNTTTSGQAIDQLLEDKTPPCPSAILDL